MLRLTIWTAAASLLLLLPALAAAAPEKIARPAAASVVAAPPPPPPQQLQKKQCSQSAGTAEPFFELCPHALGKDWIKFGSSCYRYFDQATQYWEPAEQDCIKLGGHLVSIGDNSENKFLAKLTYCRDAWTGRYAVNVDHLNQASNYRWTDGTNSQYGDPHNFTSITSIHEPLISMRDTRWNNNVYHTKHHYVCEVPVGLGNYTCECPSGWRQLDGYCYRMPHFPATYIEADYFCRGLGAHVTSLHTKKELRAMSLMDVETEGCPFDIWTGLIKLNPCRADYFSGSNICYTWSDRSGNYTNFPGWHSGSPIGDQKTNCVLLRDTGIVSAPCHTRARFVCKKPIGAHVVDE